MVTLLVIAFLVLGWWFGLGGWFGGFMVMVCGIVVCSCSLPWCCLVASGLFDYLLVGFDSFPGWCGWIGVCVLKLVACCCCLGGCVDLGCLAVCLR